MVDAPDEGLKCLRFGGELVCVSSTVKDMGYAFRNALSVHHVFYGVAHTVKHDERPRRQLYEILRQLCIYFWDKKLDPMIGEIVGFDGVKDALKKLKQRQDRKSTRLNSSHVKISYAVFCLKKKKKTTHK